MGIFNKQKQYETILFNRFWYFQKCPFSIPHDNINFANFNEVVLPHDFLIENINNLYETTKGFYYKSFELEKNDFIYYLYFEGIYQDSTIYINNKLAFEWKNGYSSFYFDVTKYLVDGLNEILVEVRHEAPNSRWYSGSGIYRNVYFIKKQKAHLDIDNIYVHSKYLNNSYNLTIDTKTLNSKNLILKQQIYDNDNLVAETISEINDQITTQLFNNLNVKNWSVNNPYLYTLKTTLIKDLEIIDQVEQKIGFKHLDYNVNQGLFLNGKHLKLNGVCQHHDLGGLGSAIHKEVLKNRLLLLKDMGVNAIRTAHTIPEKYLMELADELGFLIVSEAFDMWIRPKTTYDYARFFKDWVFKDVANWIKRDRNHVSLLMWSIGNEIYDTNSDLEAIETTKILRDLIRKYDYNQNAKITIGSNFMTSEIAQACSNLLDCQGYNYAERLYDEHHQKYPHWLIYGSETASTVQSRGKYHFPLKANKLTNIDMQCSSLGNSTTSWGAKSVEDVVTIDSNIKYSLGQFIWTGFDYIGEPTPYQTKNSYFGQIDTAGFIKDNFYVYQAAWNDFNEKPVIHIFPYWNFNEGELIDVRVVTNCPNFKLYLNDKLLKEETNINKLNKIIYSYQIPFTEGTLKAIGYNNEGEEICNDLKTSFKDAKKLKLTLNKTTLKADGNDLLELTIETLDENNNLVLNNNQVIEVITDQKLVILSLDSGDSTDYVSYKNNSKKLFSNKLKALIGSTFICGKSKIVVKSNDLYEEVIVNIEEVVLEGENLEAFNNHNYLRSHQAYEKVISVQKQFVPIREIKLLTNEKHLTKDNNEVLVDYQILPKNYDPQQIYFEIVNDKGVKSELATIEILSNQIKVKALGDGKFVLRAMAKNDKEHIDIISEIVFRASDIGTYFKNPYNFISASNFDLEEGSNKSGIEYGIATSNNSSLIFENVDFNIFGTKELTLPIFSFDSKELEITLSIRKDKEKFHHFQTFKYFKETIWEVYQSETYQLKELLKDKYDLKFTFSRGVHFKGFSFNQMDYNNYLINANQYSNIYGDSFILNNNIIENIGNNVVVEFDNLIYQNDVNKIAILGQSNIDVNLITLKITDENNNVYTKKIDFKYSQNIVEQIYELTNIKGIIKIEFIFLPGSNFNFKAFKLFKED